MKKKKASRTVFSVVAVAFRKGVDMKIAMSILLISVVAMGAFWISRDGLAQKLPDDASTPVSRRPATNDEKEFTKEFAKRYPNRKKIKLGDFMPESKDVGIGLGGHSEFLVDMGQTKEQIASKIISDLACKSDLVVIGRPSSKVAHLSSDESFIYTGYDLRIVDVVFSPSSELRVGDSIKLAWPGGKIRLENRTIEAIDFNYAQLSEGASYLLFLTYTPGAKGYVPVGVESDYEVGSDSLKANSPGRIGKGEELSKSDFIAGIRHAASMCGGTK